MGAQQLRLQGGRGGEEGGGVGGISAVALERRRAARYRHLQRGYARVMCREVGRLERREVKRREAERLGVRPDSSREERGGDREGGHDKIRRHMGVGWF